MALRDDLRERIQDDVPKLDNAALDACLASAFRILTQDYPRPLTDRATGDGTRRYPLQGNDTAPAVTAAITGWEEGVSKVLRVAYPIGATDYTELKTDDWDVVEHRYEEGGGTKWLPTLVLCDDITNGELFNITIGIAWTEGDSQLQGRVLEALLGKASAIAHRKLHAIYTRMGDSTLQADSVDAHDIARAQLDAADEQDKVYRECLGLLTQGSGESSPGAGFVRVDMDPTASTGGRYLFR